MILPEALTTLQTIGRPFLSMEGQNNGYPVFGSLLTLSNRASFWLTTKLRLTKDFSKYNLNSFVKTFGKSSPL